MCGIAGIIDLVGQRPAPEGVVQRMARAITHRGPDEEGFLEQPGISLAARRLSIVDLADGQQPMTNEDRSVFVVFNGELFDYVERREELVRQGHRFRTHCDTEIIPHLWEDHHEGMWERLRGQFAIALWDERRRQLHLGRDRFGIAPLFWSRQGDWLLFASEIKGLLASGMVPARPDRQGTRSRLHLLRRAGTEDLFRRGPTPAARTLPAHCAWKFGHESGHCRTRLLGNGFSGAG